LVISEDETAVDQPDSHRFVVISECEMILAFKRSLNFPDVYRTTEPLPWLTLLTIVKYA
jgi:hypothetical protein